MTITAAMEPSPIIVDTADVSCPRCLKLQPVLVVVTSGSTQIARGIAICDPESGGCDRYYAWEATRTYRVRCAPVEFQ
jgi:hypothetical protein